MPSTPPEDRVPDPRPGGRILRAAIWSTALLVLTSALAAIWPASLGRVHAVVSFGCFLVGCALMLSAFATGVARSRTEAVSTAGLFLLADDVAPPDVRHVLRGALAVQVVAVVAAASVRPFTEVAFGILAPMLGVGLMSLWGAREGRFPPRAGARPIAGAEECGDG
jgi:hypothetical protein